MTRCAFITGLLLALGVGAAVFLILEERYCGVVGYARNSGMSEGQIAALREAIVEKGALVATAAYSRC